MSSRALAKDPLCRWDGCTKFVGELRRALVPLPGSVPAITSGDQPGTPATTATWNDYELTTGRLLTEDRASLPLRRTVVRAFLTSGTAEITLTQIFFNPHDHMINATYAFPWPEEAAVTRLRMQVGDNPMSEGGVRETKAAREVHEDAAVMGLTTTLLTESAPSVYTSSVANIPPQQQVQIEITYLQPLRFQSGRYQLVVPIVTADAAIGPSHLEQHLNGIVPSGVFAASQRREFLPSNGLDIEVDLDAGVPLTGYDSPSHDIETFEEEGTSRVRIRLRKSEKVPNSDFILNYRVNGDHLEHALIFEPGADHEPGTFLWITAPPFSQFAGKSPREVILAFDCTTAMSEESFDQTKRAAIQWLERLEPLDAFNIFGFDRRVQRFAPTSQDAVEMNVQRGRAFIEGLALNNASTLEQLLRFAACSQTRRAAASGCRKYLRGP